MVFYRKPTVPTEVQEETPDVCSLRKESLWQNLSALIRDFRGIIMKVIHVFMLIVALVFLL